MKNERYLRVRFAVWFICGKIAVYTIIYHYVRVHFEAIIYRPKNVFLHLQQAAKFWPTVSTGYMANTINNSDYGGVPRQLCSFYVCYMHKEHFPIVTQLPTKSAADTITLYRRFEFTCWRIFTLIVVFQSQIGKEEMKIFYSCRFVVLWSV